MRTTLDINDALLKELRKKAEQAGRPFRSVVEETIALGLARQAGTTATRKRFRVRPHALNVKPGFRGVSFNQVYDQLEAEDASK
jgi:ribosomal protein L9